MGNRDSLLNALRDAGFRLTPQRRAICDALSSSTEHPTAHIIHRELTEDYPSLSLTTVYNTLDALMRVGAIHGLGAAGDEAMHYEPNTEPHVNVACISCHKIVDYDSATLHALDAELREQFADRNLLGSRLVYYTDCIYAQDPSRCPFSGACCNEPEHCIYRDGGCDSANGGNSAPSERRESQGGAERRNNSDG